MANARHAIAIDEKRQSFIPTLWTGIDDKPTVKQVWFPGVHSDIGGGYGRVGLSDGALLWMMDEAEELGLDLRSGVRAQLAPDPFGQLHDSVTGFFKSMKTRPRDVPLFSRSSKLLHKSALERHATPPLSQGAYWKTISLEKNGAASVDVFAQDRWNYTGIYLEAGAKYDFTAAGEWIDRTIKCGPKGARDKDFQIGELIQGAFSVVGKLETLYRNATGNHEVDFWYTKQEEAADWFTLVGVVANGVYPTPDPKKETDYLPHEVIVIGEKNSFTPKQGGYLYAFANDAWQMYDNNRGSVKLTVKRVS